MEKKVQDAFSFIVDSETPAEMVELLDAYIQMYKKSVITFIMPTEHQKLFYAVVKFSSDLKGYVEFISQTRDVLGEKHFDKMQFVFRRINSRFTQIERRRRLKSATEIIGSVLRKDFTVGQKNAVESWLENYWSKERLDDLEYARKRGKSIRLSTEERAEICDGFWSTVDHELKNKRSPIPPKVVYEQLTSI